MVKAVKEGNTTYITFSDTEANSLGLNPANEYELAKAKEGIWILTEGKEKPMIDDAEQKIMSHLKKLSLSERVEGNFEKKLTPDELKKFEEMLKQNKIEKFKLNKNYKKAVYQLAGQGQKKYENKEKPFAEYTLEKDGFVVVKNEQRAKALSNEFKGQIKEGKIKGTRAFTGEFYIIENELLESAEEKVLDELKKLKTSHLSNLNKNTKLTNTLIRIALEFLKEDGQVIEKKKDHYQYIE